MSFNILDFLRSVLTLTVFDYLEEILTVSLGADAAEFIVNVLVVFVISTFCLLIVIFLIWLERKVIARMQDRVGPNRVGGKFGLLQTVADVLKLLTKEDISPAGADRAAYNLAPLLTVMAALLMWAVVPFAPSFIGTDLNVALFYVLAVSSTSVVALLLAGWGSNNKYALLGAFRSVAQLVSYEVPMVLALIVPILLANSMGMVAIIDAQTVPFMFVVPLSALIFFVSALAETGRTPFDLLEAESEIVAGFHVEYGGMKFGMFFLAEFISTLFMSALFATIYMGGWRFFGLEELSITIAGNEWVIGNVLGLMVFFAKTFTVYFLFIWIRGTLPRVRIDQMLNLNWKFLVPLSLVLLLEVALVEKLIPAGTDPFYRAGIHLLANLLVAFATLEILRRVAHRKRQEAGLLPGDDMDDDEYTTEIIDGHAVPATH